MVCGLLCGEAGKGLKFEVSLRLKPFLSFSLWFQTLVLFQAFGDAPQHVGGVDGLGQGGEVMAVVTRSFEEIDGGGLTGEQEDLALWNGFGDDDCQLDARHSGHDDVRDQEVRLDFASELQCTLSIVGGQGGEAAFRKDDGERIRYDSLVVDDENDRALFFGEDGDDCETS